MIDVAGDEADETGESEFLLLFSEACAPGRENRWRFGQAIKPGPVMLIASLGDQRPDVSSETTFDIGLTEVAGIGKHGGGLSEVLRDFR